MAITATLLELAEACVRRAKTSADLLAATGANEDGGPRLVYGHPKDLLDRPYAGLKLVSWHLAYQSPQGEVPRRIHWVTDAWVWPDDATGGFGAFKAIDQALCDLFGGGKNAVAWADAESGVLLEARCVSASMPVSKFIRGRRVWEVSEASA